MNGPDTFALLGPDEPRSPVILSVPHAGRFYPPEFETFSRVPPARLRPLEDRYADLLIESAVESGFQAVVQNVARAWIDLNRDEREFDPLAIAGNVGFAAIASAKVRGGLGLVPQRIASAGPLWRGKLTPAQLAERIDRYHRPYHAALAAALDRAIARFGVAVLIDIHSMPPLPPPEGAARSPTTIVLGDLFGRSATARVTEAALESLKSTGEGVALNTPYAGGHVLARHGRPERNIHAIQVEFDRSLYLEAFEPGPGLSATRRAVLSLVQVLDRESRATPLPLAAE